MTHIGIRLKPCLPKTQTGIYTEMCKHLLPNEIAIIIITTISIRIPVSYLIMYIPLQDRFIY